MTTITRVTKAELAAMLGVSPFTLDLWRKRGLITQPDDSGPRLLFELGIVRADVLKNRLKVNAEFLKQSEAVECTMNYTLLKRLLKEWAERQGFPGDAEEFATEMIKYAEELAADEE